MPREVFIQNMLVSKFLMDHQDAFSERERKMILDYYPNLRREDFVPDLIREVYDELGLIPDEKNIYIEFLELLKSVFPIENRHIIEVGGGTIPRLGKRISLLQTGGSIVVYDPRLSKREVSTDKMKLVRKSFSRYEKVQDTNLMIGLMPCEGAEDLILSATENNIDFMLAFCEGGAHGEDYDYFEDDDEWLHSMIYTAKSAVESKKMGKVKIQYLTKSRDPYPVIYNERYQSM